MPRIFTPPLEHHCDEGGQLLEEFTHGYACIAFAEQILGLRLFPWQKWLLIHALELDDDGLYRFRTVIVEVARQNGKSLLLVVLALWHLYALGSEEVIGTAQDLTRSEASWAEAVEWAEKVDELEPYLLDVKRGHPKVMTVLYEDEATGEKRECVYRVAAASRRGARGFSGDLVLMDELREHQSWDSWASVTKTMMARPSAQAWAFSNAGDSLSVVLRNLRAQAHRALGWPDGDADAEVLGELDPEVADLIESSDISLGWFEWSAPPNSRRSDMVALAQANPSKDHTEITRNCITERALLHAMATDPPYIYDTECRCIWVSTSDGGPFVEGSWLATHDDSARPAEGAKSAICIEISDSTRKRERTYIARAALDDAGNPVFGIWADQVGSDWVLPWLKERRDGYSTIILRSGAGTPALSLLDEIEAAELPLEKWGAADVSAAHGQMFDALREGKIRHLAHPGLDMAATSAAIKLQSDGAWVLHSIKSPSDTAPLMAALGAVWGLAHLPDDRPSIYSGADGADVLVL